jgi:drug/metabolite transporter (DMT)-like permease
MTTTKRFPAPLWMLLFIGIAAISFSSIFIRWSEAPVSVIAMYRLFISNVLMLPFLVHYWPEVKLLNRREWFSLFVSGTMLGLHFLLWMSSLRHTTVTSSTAIMALEPILVMLGGFWLFRHKTPVLAIAGMVIAIAGSVLIGWGDFGLSAEALTGDVLSFLGTVAVAFHMLLGKSMRAGMSAFVYSFFVFAAAAIVLAIYNVGLGYSFTGYQPKEWGLFLLLAVVPTLFGHYLFNWLLKYMKAVSVSMTVLGEPLGAGILAYFLLGEDIRLYQGIAGLVLLFGVWLFIQAKESPSGN